MEFAKMLHGIGISSNNNKCLRLARFCSLSFIVITSTDKKWERFTIKIAVAPPPPPPPYLNTIFFTSRTLAEVLDATDEPWDSSCDRQVSLMPRLWMTTQRISDYRGSSRIVGYFILFVNLDFIHFCISVFWQRTLYRKFQSNDPLNVSHNSL